MEVCRHELEGTIGILRTVHVVGYIHMSWARCLQCPPATSISIISMHCIASFARPHCSHRPHRSHCFVGVRRSGASSGEMASLSSYVEVRPLRRRWLCVQKARGRVKWFARANGINKDRRATESAGPPGFTDPRLTTCDDPPHVKSVSALHLHEWMRRGDTSAYAPPYPWLRSPAYPTPTPTPQRRRRS
jgi:hypothetical protein